MRRGGAEEKEPGLIGFAVFEEIVEIAAGLVEDFLFGLFDGGAGFNELCCFFRKIRGEAAGFFVGVLLLANGGVGGSARAPDFIGFADLIAVIAQKQWK